MNSLEFGQKKSKGHIKKLIKKFNFNCAFLVAKRTTSTV